MTGITVLHIAPNLAQGGAERVLHSLATQNRPGLRHSLALMENVAFFDVSGLDVVSLGFDLSSRAGALLWLAPALRRLRRLVREKRPDIIQGWLYYGAFLTLGLRDLGLPIVWAIHNTTLPGFRSNPVLHAVDRVLAGASAHVPHAVVYCAETARAVHEQRGYRGSAHVIDNGVDTARFRPDPARRAAARACLGIADGITAVGLYARYDAQKDIPGCLDAVATFTAHRDVCLILAGRGMDKANAELHGLLRARGPLPRTLRLGPVAAMEDLIAAADVVMLGSRYGEALPMVLLEALASGTPIVATRVGDVARLPVPEEALVPAGNTRLLSGALRAVAGKAASPEWQHAFARTRQLFGLERCLDGYTALYVGIAGRPISPERRVA